jgi:hypothetical protein
MKNILFFILFLFSCQLAVSQEVTVRILGSHRYSEMAEKKVHLIDFNYDPDICNLLTQNKTIEIQVNEFIAHLQLDKIEYELLHKETSSFNPENKKQFELILPIDNPDVKIQKIINSKGIILVRTYYKFSDNPLLDEDSRAILAYKNSKNKATNLAKNLNCKNIEIVNIDDDTSDVNLVYELVNINLDEEKKELINALFLKLGDFESNYNIKKEGSYNLWVTYKIKMH